MSTTDSHREGVDTHSYVWLLSALTSGRCYLQLMHMALAQTHLLSQTHDVQKVKEVAALPQWKAYSFRKDTAQFASNTFTPHIATQALVYGHTLTCTLTELEASVL